MVDPCMHYGQGDLMDGVEFIVCLNSVRFHTCVKSFRTVYGDRENIYVYLCYMDKTRSTSLSLDSILDS